jgi:hypothetical protein
MTMENQQPIMDTIEPEYVERLAVRKQEIERGGYARPGIVAALAIGSVPIALAALSRDVYGQSISTAVKGVLDFALALEIFENEFYKAVLGTSSYAPYNAAFATVRAQVTGPALATIQQIQKHEAAHVATLLATGATDVFGLQVTSTNAQFDFTGARGAGNGPFAKATTNLGFLLEVAQGAEDTGVRAYKGQAANLLAANAPAILEAALRIHSVEARHASRIRRIRRSLNTSVTALRWSGTVRGGDAAAAGATDAGDTATVQQQVTAAFTAIYGKGANATTAPSEANVTQAGVNVSSLALTTGFGTEAAQEAFDEPLDRADVVAIVQPFFIPTIS